MVTVAKHDGARATFAQMTSGVSVAAFGSATDAVAAGQQGSSPPGPPAGRPTSARHAASAPLNGDNRFAYLVGTSMATPQVAGLVALMRAASPTSPPPSSCGS